MHQELSIASNFSTKNQNIWSNQQIGCLKVLTKHLYTAKQSTGTRIETEMSVTEIIGLHNSSQLEMSEETNTKNYRARIEAYVQSLPLRSVSSHNHSVKASSISIKGGSAKKKSVELGRIRGWNQAINLKVRD